VSAHEAGLRNGRDSADRPILPPQTTGMIIHMTFLYPKGFSYRRPNCRP